MKDVNSSIDGRFDAFKAIRVQNPTTSFYYHIGDRSLTDMHGLTRFRQDYKQFITDKVSNSKNGFHHIVLPYATTLYETIHLQVTWEQ